MSGSEGKRMSLYGKSEMTPEEAAGLWKNIVWRTDDITVKHLANVGDDSGYFPGVKRWSRHEIDDSIKNKKNSWFGHRLRPTEADVKTNYDRLFYTKDGYDCKMHRDDRKSVTRIGCSIHDEITLSEQDLKELLPLKEVMRSVPLLTSSNYGHQLKTCLEPFSRDYVQVERVLKGFYYTRGTGLPPIKDNTL